MAEISRLSQFNYCDGIPHTTIKVQKMRENPGINQRRRARGLYEGSWAADSGSDGASPESVFSFLYDSKPSPIRVEGFALREEKTERLRFELRVSLTTHNGFRDRPIRPLWHLSKICKANFGSHTRHRFLMAYVRSHNRLNCLTEKLQLNFLLREASRILGHRF